MSEPRADRARLLARRVGGSSWLASYGRHSPFDGQRRRMARVQCCSGWRPRGHAGPTDRLGVVLAACASGSLAPLASSTRLGVRPPQARRERLRTRPHLRRSGPPRRIVARHGFPTRRRAGSSQGHPDARAEHRPPRTGLALFSPDMALTEIGEHDARRPGCARVRPSRKIARAAGGGQRAGAIAPELPVKTLRPRTARRGACRGPCGKCPA